MQRSSANAMFVAPRAPEVDVNLAAALPGKAVVHLHFMTSEPDKFVRFTNQRVSEYGHLHFEMLQRAIREEQHYSSRNATVG
jgi:hypothetical protein